MLFLFFLLGYWARLPRPLFETPYSTVLEDRDGRLLSARIATDGQWRFPEGDSLPRRFTAALLEFEDRRFFRHAGVDARALARAAWQNLRAGRVVSGGSTLSMQVVRLARGNPPRTLFNKGREILQALHLDLRYSKKEILALFAAHAPFGGNVVGLETAAWRYFGKEPARLSWAECATLAVLPNRPGLIHPGRNREALRRKRDRLLERLHLSGRLDTLTWSLAREEALPDAPHPLPQWAPHLLQRAGTRFPGKARIRSSVARHHQRRVTEVLRRHQPRLAANHIHNLAALILDVETGEALAYVGNGPEAAEGADVDLIPAARSTGSILKPFLYAATLHDGAILPSSLLRDVPFAFDDFQPRNFHRRHDGLVPADQALQRSLNVPSVFLLQQYGIERFHADLRRLGLRTITQPPGHYGLSLILGGAEASLWDLAGAYASLARVVNHFYDSYGQYDPGDWRPATFVAAEKKPEGQTPALVREPPWLDAASIWHTLSAMEQVERPTEEGQWDRFSSRRRIAWKTGTSFGFRDAWAIGLDPRFVVAVWVGNADGEGRPGLVGVRAAAPVLFDLFDLLPRSDWFEAPLDELAPLRICRQSGFRALPHCPADTVLTGHRGRTAPGCPYHQRVLLTADKRFRARPGCPEGEANRTESWFVLPPREAHYYRRGHPDYAPLPPVHPGCPEGSLPTRPPMQIIYPQAQERVLLPIQLDGTTSSLVFKAAHRHPGTRIHWHLGETYLGSTREPHDMPVQAPPGQYRLILTDEHGHRLERPVHLIDRPE